MVEGQAIFDATAVDDVLAVLRRGGLLVYPTDTLYGLGADPFNADAMRRLLPAQRRPGGEPASVGVADLAAAGGLAAIPPRAEALCAPWLPGAVTLLFRPGPKAPPSIVSAQNTVALRVPKHPVALMLAKRFGPITAT